MTNSANISSLPTELIPSLFGFLSGVEAAKTSRVCKQWNQILQQESIWQRFLKQEFLYWHRQGNEPLKQTYEREYIFNKNIEEGKYKLQCIKGFGEYYDIPTGRMDDIGRFINDTGYTGRYINSLSLTLGEKSIISATNFDNIQLWDLKTQKYTRSLTGHIGGVWSVICTQDGQLISGGSDSDPTIKIWNLETGACIHTFTGHTNGIFALTLTRNGLLISGSFDYTIKVWDLNHKQCIRTLTGHASPILSIGEIQSECLIGESGDLTEIAAELLIAKSTDGVMKIWELTTGNCLHTFTEDDRPKVECDRQGRAFLRFNPDSPRANHGWIFAVPFSEVSYFASYGYMVTSGKHKIVMTDNDKKINVITKSGTIKQLALQEGMILSPM